MDMDIDMDIEIETRVTNNRNPYVGLGHGGACIILYKHCQ